MSSPFFASNRYRIAAVLFGAGALAVAACSSLGTGSGAVPSHSGALPGRASPAIPVPPPSYSFTPVEEPGANTLVTGVNNGVPGSQSCNTFSNGHQGNGQIVGVYYTANNQYQSFSANCPWAWPNLTPIPSPPGDYSPVYLSGLNESKTYAGYGKDGVVSGGFSAVAGYILNDGSWSSPITDPNQGTGACAQTYLTGIDNNFIAVGYYLKNNGGNGCVAQAFEEYTVKYPGGGSPQFVDMHPSASYSDSWAWGINNKDDVVGTMSSSGTSTVGWYYADQAYYTLSNSSSNTHPYGLNWSDVVVGSYVDTSNETHGFLVPNPEMPNFETIDDLLGLTVLTSVNDNPDLISGWTQANSSSDYEGFVGTCMGGSCPHSGADPKRNSH